ncbi:MAG: Gldg family protein [Clostridia bacterium]|nr:Gldg family protein [Clostridia bacterium]
MKDILENMNKKTIKQMLITIMLFVVTIVAYFAINILVEKLNIRDIDMTESKVYSLTNESKEKIKNINEKIEIQIINFDQYLYASNILNSVNVIKEYSKINNNITIEQITDSEDTSASIVLKCNGNTKTLSIDDLYTYEFSSETYTNESLDITEETMTNAIIEITTENNKYIYLYTTHSPYADYPESYFSTLIGKLDEKLNEINYLDLTTTQNIPEDCDCLIIPTLKEDISETERDAIINYINNGGNILLLQESYLLLQETYGVSELKLPNFQSVIDLYGFSFSEGIVMEQSSENMLNNIPEFISVEINSDSTIGKYLDENAKMLLIDSAKINFKDNDTLKSLNVSYEVIAQASDSAFLRKDLTITDYSKLDSDESAPNAILSALITKKVGDDKTSELIVFSNSIFATDSSVPVKDILTEQSSVGTAIYFNKNEEVLEKSIKYLTDNKDLLILRKKYYDNIPTIKLIQNGTTVQILFGLPILIILAGFIVWRIRKNKK